MWRNNADLGTTMEQMAVLAENLRGLAYAETMDMKALCRRIGVTKESMMRWMTVPPVQRIKKNKLMQLAAYFGVTEEWLLEPHTGEAAGITVIWTDGRAEAGAAITRSSRGGSSGTRPPRAR